MDESFVARFLSPELGSMAERANRAEAVNETGKAAFQQGNFNVAKDHFAMAAGLNPCHPKYYSNWAGESVSLFDVPLCSHTVSVFG